MVRRPAVESTWGQLRRLKICRRGQSMFWPLKCQILPFKTVVGKLCKFHIMKDSVKNRRSNCSRIGVESGPNRSCKRRCRLSRRVATRCRSVMGISRIRSCQVSVKSYRWWSKGRRHYVIGRLLEAGPPPSPPVRRLRNKPRTGTPFSHQQQILLASRGGGVPPVWFH